MKIPLLHETLIMTMNGRFMKFHPPTNSILTKVVKNVISNLLQMVLIRARQKKIKKNPMQQNLKKMKQEYKAEHWIPQVL